MASAFSINETYMRFSLEYDISIFSSMYVTVSKTWIDDLHPPIYKSTT